MMNAKHGPLLTIGVLLLLSGVVRADAVRLALQPVTAAPGAEVEIPVTIEKPQQLGGLQFFLTHDPSVLEITDVVAGEAAGGALVDQRSEEAGVVRVAMITDEPVTSGGELLIIQGRIAEDAAGTSALEIVEPRAWEHDQILEMLVEASSGEVAVRPAVDWRLWALIAAITLLLILLLLWALGRRKRKRHAQVVGAA